MASGRSEIRQSYLSLGSIGEVQPYRPSLTWDLCPVGISFIESQLEAL